MQITHKQKIAFRVVIPMGVAYWWLLFIGLKGQHWALNISITWILVNTLLAAIGLAIACIDIASSGKNRLATKRYYPTWFGAFQDVYAAILFAIYGHRWVAIALLIQQWLEYQAMQPVTKEDTQDDEDHEPIEIGPIGKL